MNCCKRPILAILTLITALSLLGCPRKETVSAAVPPPPPVASAPPPTQQPILVLSGVMAGNIQQLMASPIYPPEAKAKGLTGTVLLRDVITTKGTLTHLRVIHSSDPIFTDAAITSVQQSSYRSFMQNESVEIEITVNFTK